MYPFPWHGYAPYPPYAPMPPSLPDTPDDAPTIANWQPMATGDVPYPQWNPYAYTPYPYSMPPNTASYQATDAEIATQNAYAKQWDSPESPEEPWIRAYEKHEA